MIFLYWQQLQKKETRSLFSFSPFNTKLLDIEGVYQISSDIEKFAFTSMKTISSLIGVGENSYTSIEVALDGNVNKADFEKEINNLLSSDLSVLDKQDLNPALYKMLNTENLAVYLIFSLVALISMFNLVGSITIMMVEKKKDLRVIEILGGQKKDFNKIFFSWCFYNSFWNYNRNWSCLVAGYVTEFLFVRFCTWHLYSLPCLFNLY